MPYFQIRDLMINVIDDRLKLKRRGAALCTQEQPTFINCGHASPVMQMVKVLPRFERVVERSRKMIESGDPDGAPALVEIAADVGKEAFGGAIMDVAVAMPDPNCGNSLETIPTDISPVAGRAYQLELKDLPAIKFKMKQALTAIEKIESEYAPRGGVEVEVVQDHLRSAAGSTRSK